MRRLATAVGLHHPGVELRTGITGFRPSPRVLEFGHVAVGVDAQPTVGWQGILSITDGDDSIGWGGEMYPSAIPPTKLRPKS